MLSRTLYFCLTGSNSNRSSTNNWKLVVYSTVLNMLVLWAKKIIFGGFHGLLSTQSLSVDTFCKTLKYSGPGLFTYKKEAFAIHIGSVGFPPGDIRHAMFKLRILFLFILCRHFYMFDVNGMCWPNQSCMHHAEISYWNERFLLFVWDILAYLSHPNYLMKIPILRYNGFWE